MKRVVFFKVFVVVIFFVVFSVVFVIVNFEQWVQDVVIYCDEWGVLYICVQLFVLMVYVLVWVQCEDYFLQFEDMYIKVFGCFVEVVGEFGYQSDLEVVFFDFVVCLKEDFEMVFDDVWQIGCGFVVGYNVYLVKYLEVKLVLFECMEFFYVFVYSCFMIFGCLFGVVDVLWCKFVFFLVQFVVDEQEVEVVVVLFGLNQWVFVLSCIVLGNVMFFINLYQFWYGFGMFIEMYVFVEGDFNFLGMMFFGFFFFMVGFSEYFGWVYIVNEVDIFDVYCVIFDYLMDCFKYCYGDGWWEVMEWLVMICVKMESGIEECMV